MENLRRVNTSAAPAAPTIVFTKDESGRGHGKPQPDTGYTSEGNFPFVREDTIFLPAGYHADQKRKSCRDAPKILPTYYELKFRRNSEYWSQTQGRRNELDRVRTNRESSERHDHPQSRSALSKYYPDLQECQPDTQIENNPRHDFQMQEKPEVYQSNTQNSPKENHLNVSSTSGSNQKLLPKTYHLQSRDDAEVLKKEAREQVKSTVIKESRQGSDKSVSDLSGSEADRSISSSISASASLNSQNISNPAAKVNTSAIIDSTTNTSINCPTTVTSNITNTSSGGFNSTSSLNSSTNRFYDGSSACSVRLTPWARKQIIRSKYLQSCGKSGDTDIQMPSVKELTGMASETRGNKRQDLGKQMSQTDQRSDQN